MVLGTQTGSLAPNKKKVLNMQISQSFRGNAENFSNTYCVQIHQGLRVAASSLSLSVPLSLFRGLFSLLTSSVSLPHSPLTLAPKFPPALVIPSALTSTCLRGSSSASPIFIKREYVGSNSHKCAVRNRKQFSSSCMRCAVWAEKHFLSENKHHSHRDI